MEGGGDLHKKDHLQITLCVVIRRFVEQKIPVLRNLMLCGRVR